MESNTDKEMRDKLRGVEYPFDPKAWEQMDAMLEKDRKPKAFIWWWTGGIAAALILGAGLFGYNQFTTRENAGNPLTSNIEKQNSSAVNSTNPKEMETNSTQAHKPFAGNHSKTSNSNSTEAPSPAGLHETKVVAPGNTNIQPVNNKMAKAVNKHIKKITPSFNTASNIKATHVTPADKQNAPSHQVPKPSQASSKESSTGPIQAALSSSVGQLNVQALAEGLTDFVVDRAKSQLSLAETDYMLSRGPDQLTPSEENAENDMKKKDDDGVDLKKLKKKAAFNYSLGIAANITGSTLGNQGSANIFTKKPSYMVGLTQDFMFAKRVAVTTGFMFAQTSYSASDFNYTCSITELNIPVGLKAYLVSKSKVRFYLDAGIINHIKLKETFTPIYNDQYANFSGSSPGYSFGPIPNTLGISTVNTNSSGNNAEAPYSINNGKRYYASFYTGAGVEFIVKSHLVFFTEPMFSMTLEKILAPDRYKYDLGLIGGFRYQF